MRNALIGVELHPQLNSFAGHGLIFGARFTAA